MLTVHLMEDEDLLELKTVCWCALCSVYITHTFWACKPTVVYFFRIWTTYLAYLKDYVKQWFYGTACIVKRLKNE